MNKSKKRSKTVEVNISGHSVSLTFAPEQNPAVAQQVRVSLIDSYIRRHRTDDEKRT